MDKFCVCLKSVVDVSIQIVPDEAFSNNPSLPSTTSRTCLGLGKHVITTLHCLDKFLILLAFMTPLGTLLSFFASKSKATNSYLLSDLYKLFKIGAPALPKPITPTVMVLSIYQNLNLDIIKGNSLLITIYSTNFVRRFGILFLKLKKPFFEYCQQNRSFSSYKKFNSKLYFDLISII